jgi:hypothetical protein
MQKKIKYNFIVSSENVLPQDFLFRNKVDLFLFFNKNEKFHFITFSHVLMDGMSFMLFCIDFYSFLGKFNINHQMDSTRNYESFNIFKILELISIPRLLKNNLLLENICNQPNYNVISLPLRKFKSKSFNQNVCKILENICYELKIISSNQNLRIGIPINLSSIKDRINSNYGNFILIIPDNASLEFSKNYFIVTIIAIFLKFFPLRFINKNLICKFVDLCFNQIDIVYSNMDARYIDNLPVQLIYSAPVFKNKFFTFSILTHNQNVNIIIKSYLLDTSQLNNIKLLFKKKYLE